MSTPVREVQVRDEVKHITQDATGVILAKYPGQVNPLNTYVDVRLEGDRVYYGSPIENWITTRKVEDLE